MGSELLAGVGREIRLRGYSPSTERAYRKWTAAYVRFHGMVHPEGLGVEHMEAFLVDLAESHSASSVNQAHAALVFLYRDVLRVEPERLEEVPWSKGKRRLPAVLSREEVRAVLTHMRPGHQVVGALMYGTGLRISEALGLRVKDVDFDLGHVIVRDGKGGKDRVTILPRALKPALARHLEEVRVLHGRDVGEDAGWVDLPDGFARKSPNAGQRWPWQWVFPAGRRGYLRTGQVGRQPMHPSTIQKAVARAAVAARVPKRVHPHVFRHSFATHLLEDGTSIRQVQELMGHTDIRVTMQYLHLTRDAAASVVSPLDRWLGDVDDL